MSIFSTLANVIKDVVVGIGRKAKVTEIIGIVYGNLVGLIADFNAYRGADAEKRVREFWEEFDTQTGIGGLDLIHDLPPKAEERMFDGLKAFGLELSLWSVGVYGNRPTTADVDQVMHRIADGYLGSSWHKAQAPAGAQVKPDNGSAPAPVDAVLLEQVRAIALYPEHVTSTEKFQQLAAATLWLMENANARS